MYTPPPFKMKSRASMFDAIEQWNFGLVITGNNADLQTSYLPFILDRTNNQLLGHFARANPHWKLLSDPNSTLVSFQGPHCYISPSWYAGKNLVPTWNYLSIQVRGPATLIDDKDDCANLMNRLVEKHEQALPAPWSTEQMDEKSLNAMMRAIVCFRIEIDSIEGKAKLSQNRSEQDRLGVIKVLETSTHSDEQAVSTLMQKELTTSS